MGLQGAKLAGQIFAITFWKFLWAALWAPGKRRDHMPSSYPPASGTRGYLVQAVGVISPVSLSLPPLWFGHFSAHIFLGFAICFLHLRQYSRDSVSFQPIRSTGMWMECGEYGVPIVFFMIFSIAMEQDHLINRHWVSDWPDLEMMA